MSSECEIEVLSEARSSNNNKNTEKSFKWQNYEKCGDKLKCKTCKMLLSLRSGTDSLKYHVKQHFKHENQIQINKYFYNTEKSEKTFDECLMEFIVKGMHSFSIVGEKEFLNLLKSINKDVKVMSRQTLQRNCLKKFEECELIVIEKLKNVNSKISITTDIWTSLANRSYAVITAHFNDNNNLNHILIDFSLLPSPHNGENIMKRLKETFEKYDITSKVIAVTSDNAKNNIRAMQLLQNWFKEKSVNVYHENLHIRCFAHVLNIAVQEGLKCIEINNLRSLISDITCSPKKNQILEETAKSLKVTSLKLKMDVKTRWNSFYDMLDRALTLRPVLAYLVDGNKDFADHRLKINDQLWSFAEELKDFLKPFYESTLLISASNYPSSSIVLPIFERLMLHLKDHKISNPNVKLCADSMKLKLKEYEFLLENELIIFASILDPRVKLEFFEDKINFCEIKERFEKVFNENYKKETSLQENVQMSFRQSFFKKKKLDLNDEISNYLNSQLENDSIDPFEWWTNNRKTYPNLSKMALDYLIIMASSVPSEQAFSKSGELITKKRNRLENNTIKAMMLLNSWIGFV
jgi:hypothetical protein